MKREKRLAVSLNHEAEPSRANVYEFLRSFRIADNHEFGAFPPCWFDAREEQAAD